MSEELLDIALDTGGMAAWEIDLGTRAMHGAAAFRRLLGNDKVDCSTLRAFELCLYPDDLPMFRRALARAMQGEPLQCELRVRRSDGRIGHVFMAGRTAFDASGHPVRAFGVMRSADDAHAFESFMHDGGSQWTMMFDANSVGMAQVDPLSGRLLRLNDRLAELVGHSKSELVGRRLLSLVHPDERRDSFRGLQRLTQGEAASFEAEHRLVHGKGGLRWGLIVTTLLRDARGAPAHLMALVLDISERKRAEQAVVDREEQLRRVRADLEQRVQRRTAELASANSALLNEIADRRLAEDQVRQLLTRLVQSVEDERRRIARELHDTLGQHLAVLAIGLKAIEDDLGDSPAAQQRLLQIQQALRSIEDQLDRISFELRPSALDDLGLEDAMRSHVDSWTRKTGIAVDLHTHGLRTGRLPANVENTVFRVVQEALTNVHKHASASRVGIIIERRLDELRTVVEDDGCGFDSTQIATHSGRQLGLRGMAERAALVAGSLEIESMPGRGTTVYLAIPVQQDVEEARRESA